MRFESFLQDNQLDTPVQAPSPVSVRAPISCSSPHSAFSSGPSKDFSKAPEMGSLRATVSLMTHAWLEAPALSEAPVQPQVFSPPVLARSRPPPVLTSPCLLGRQSHGQLLLSKLVGRELKFTGWCGCHRKPAGWCGRHRKSLLGGVVVTTSPLGGAVVAASTLGGAVIAPNHWVGVSVTGTFLSGSAWAVAAGLLSTTACAGGLLIYVPTTNILCKYIESVCNQILQ